MSEFTECTMAAAAILDFKLIMPFLNCSTNLNQNWCECYDIDVEQTCNIGNHSIAHITMAVAAIFDVKKMIPFVKYLTILHQNW